MEKQKSIPEELHKLGLDLKEALRNYNLYYFQVIGIRNKIDSFSTSAYMRLPDKERKFVKELTSLLNEIEIRTSRLNF